MRAHASAGNKNGPWLTVPSSYFHVLGSQTWAFIPVRSGDGAYVAGFMNPSFECETTLFLLGLDISC